MSFFNFVLFKNIYLCPIMERNHTKAINVDLLLEQITTEDNRLAFHRLFELYYPALCMYAKRFITDKETREDIVQDVFFAIWENRSRISVKTSARSYLVTCARNHCLNFCNATMKDITNRSSKNKSRSMRKVVRNSTHGKNCKRY